MTSVKIHAYALGEASQSICNNICSELKGVDWRQCNEYGDTFVNQLKRPDFIIIVVDINCISGLKKSFNIIKSADNREVPTLVFSLYPKLKLSESSFITSNEIEDQRIKRDYWDLISKVSLIFKLDDYLPSDNLLISKSLIKTPLANGYDLLSLRLLLALKSFSEAITQQQLIGVDYADYRLAFTNKGIYKTKLYTSKAFSKDEIINECWLKAKVIIATIFLNPEYAIDIFSATSTYICNMLGESDALLLIAPVIERNVQGDPVINFFYR